MSTLFTARERAAWGGFVVFQSRMFRAIEDQLLAQFGLSHPEFEALLRLSLAADGRARIHELAAQSLLSRSGMSRLVERLAKDGLVVRTEAAEDGRGAYAVLTAAGRERFGAAAEAHVALVRAHFLDKLSPDEQEQLGQLWARVNRAGG